MCCTKKAQLLHLPEEAACHTRTPDLKAKASTAKGPGLHARLSCQSSQNSSGFSVVQAHSGISAVLDEFERVPCAEQAAGAPGPASASQPSGNAVRPAGPQKACWTRARCCLSAVQVTCRSSGAVARRLQAAGRGHVPTIKRFQAACHCLL